MVVLVTGRERGGGGVAIDGGRWCFVVPGLRILSVDHVLREVLREQGVTR